MRVPGNTGEEGPPVRIPLHRRAAAAFATLPGLMRGGIVLILAGAAADVAYHAIVGFSRPFQVGCCGPGYAAHIVTFAGMLVVMAGVVQTALRSRRDVPPREGGRE